MPLLALAILGVASSAWIRTVPATADCAGRRTICSHARMRFSAHNTDDSRLPVPRSPLPGARTANITLAVAALRRLTDEEEMAVDPDELRMVNPSVMVSPKLVDTIVAAVGAGVTIAGLAAMAGATGVAMYAPPLAASAVLCWAGARPPTLRAVIVGSAGATSVAVALSQAAAHLGLPAASLPPAAVTMSLAWFKLGGAFFPPAAALGALYLDSERFAALGWSYVWCPCLLSNGLIWMSAAAVAPLRRALREALVRRQWSGWQLSEEAMQLLAKLYGDQPLSDDEMCRVLGALSRRDDECELAEGEASRTPAAQVESINECARVFREQADPTLSDPPDVRPVRPERY